MSVPGDSSPLGACSNLAPASYIEIEALPTLSIDYQVVESTKSSFMVVANQKDNANREGLHSIGVRLCEGAIKCKVWFWDDITKADTRFPLDLDKEATMIAVYTSDLYLFSSDLKVFTLGMSSTRCRLENGRVAKTMDRI